MTFTTEGSLLKSSTFSLNGTYTLSTNILYATTYANSSEIFLVKEGETANTSANGVLSPNVRTYTCNGNYTIQIRTNNTTTTQISSGEKWIMLVEGSTALPYEPYGNNWYIEKQVGKVVLNGSEYYGDNTNWDNQATNILHCFTNDISTTWKVGQSGFLSDRFICTTESGRNFSQEMITCHTTNASVYIFINYSRLNGVTNASTVAQKTEALQTWLSNNNVTLYYILKNPTYEVITNNNLIQQLNNMQDIGLIENLCYVDWVGVESPTMTLQYPTNETLNAYITTEDNKLIRTEWGV